MGNLSFNQSSLEGRRDGLESSLRVGPNDGKLVPHFILPFPIPGTVFLMLFPQGESPEQFFYGVLSTRWFGNSVKGGNPTVGIIESIVASCGKCLAYSGCFFVSYKLLFLWVKIP